MSKAYNSIKKHKKLVKYIKEKGPKNRHNILGVKMSGKQAKLLRKQLRNVVKELLPETLSSELVANVQANLSRQMKEGLTKIDERQKDLQAYFIRNTVQKTPAVTTPVTEPSTKTE